MRASPCTARLVLFGGALLPYHATARRLHRLHWRADVPSRPLPLPPNYIPALLDEAPFLNMIYFLMLSKDLPPLALAQCLALARFGYWSDNRRIFFPDRRLHGQGLFKQMGNGDKGGS